MTVTGSAGTTNAPAPITGGRLITIVSEWYDTLPAVTVKRNSDAVPTSAVNSALEEPLVIRPMTVTSGFRMGTGTIRTGGDGVPFAEYVSTSRVMLAALAFVTSNTRPTRTALTETAK